MGNTSNTERIGVNAVENFFLGMNWIFREQHVSDFGIDAHIEPVEEDGPTGQLIALQIKSGRSYFQKRGENFVYYGKARHLTYWKNHVLPVFIILHDPETGHSYWQKVSDHLISHHNCGKWSIELPPSQKLDEQAINYLKNEISSDPASVRRFRLAMDLPLIREVETQLQNDAVFLTFTEWVHKTLNFRDCEMRYGDPDGSPEYEFITWATSSDINEVMHHYFPWLSYQYAREIEDASGEVEGHVLEVEINEVGKAFLAIENYFEEGSDQGEIDPWYE